MISSRADLAFLFSPALSDFFPDDEEDVVEDAEDDIDRPKECLLVEGSGWSTAGGFLKGLSSTKFFLKKLIEAVVSLSVCIYTVALNTSFCVLDYYIF